MDCVNLIGPVSQMQDSGELIKEELSLFDFSTSEKFTATFQKQYPVATAEYCASIYRIIQDFNQKLATSSPEQREAIHAEFRSTFLRFCKNEVTQTGCSISRRVKLILKGAGSELRKQAAEDMADFREKMLVQLKLAEEKGVPPSEISEADWASAWEVRKKEKAYELKAKREQEEKDRKELLEIQKKQADANMAKLLSEINGSKKKQGRKKGHKKTGPKEPHGIQEKRDETVSKKETSESSHSEDLKSKNNELALLMYKASSYKVDSRVVRWGQRDPKKIREFVDKNGRGEIIKKYEHLSEDEILKQREFHHLPGVSNLLHPKWRKIFTFPTDRGYGMWASLRREKEVLTGVIYFGIGSNGTLYHQYFEEIRAAQAKVGDLLKDKEQEEEDFPFESGSDWRSPPYQIKMNEQGGVEFHGKEEKHTCIIYAARPDLLQKEMSQSQ